MTSQNPTKAMDAPPRGLEGSLPPCLRIAVFEGRRVTWHDYGCRGETSDRFRVIVSPIAWWEPDSIHPEVIAPWGQDPNRDWFRITDDPTEAEALWLEACERLRELA